MINTEAFKERYSDFDRDIVLDILEMFISGYKENLTALNEYLNNSDLPALKKAAHALKGNIGNIDADCAAFADIDRLETMVEQLSELDNIDEIKNDVTYQKALNEIATSLEQFKSSSHALLDEARKLKMELQE
jgi:HPt (histidine-containing phosphotransfer) domain-containing protein